MGTCKPSRWVSSEKSDKTILLRPRQQLPIGCLVSICKRVLSAFNGFWIRSKLHLGKKLGSETRDPTLSCRKSAEFSPGAPVWLNAWYFFTLLLYFFTGNWKLKGLPITMQKEVGWLQRFTWSGWEWQAPPFGFFCSLLSSAWSFAPPFLFSLFFESWQNNEQAYYYVLGWPKNRYMIAINRHIRFSYSSAIQPTFNSQVWLLQSVHLLIKPGCSCQSLDGSQLQVCQPSCQSEENF